MELYGWLQTSEGFPDWPDLKQKQQTPLNGLLALSSQQGPAVYHL